MQEGEDRCETARGAVEVLFLRFLVEVGVWEAGWMHGEWSCSGGPSLAKAPSHPCSELGRGSHGPKILKGLQEQDTSTLIG